MGSTTSTSSRVVLQAANTATQTSIAKCTIECDQVLSGNTVIILPGAVVGNILFQNICVIKDASCMINQNIETTITNILNATIDQSSLSTQPLFSLTYNSTKAISSLDEIISNQIQQLISSTCTFQTNQQMNNNYIYIGNNATVGDISFVQHSTLSNVECTMDISAKADAHNEETGNVKQRATTLDSMSIFGIAIALIIVMVAVLMFVFLFRRVAAGRPKPAAPMSSPPIPSGSTYGSNYATPIPVARAVGPIPTARRV